MEHLTINQNLILKEAILKIDTNAYGFIYTIDDENIVKGILTDGDIRRCLLKGKTLNDPIFKCHNVDFIWLPADASTITIKKSFNTKVRNIPLLDKSGQLVDFASILDYMRIPIAQPSLNNKATEYVMDCMATNWISSQGKYVEQFEQQFSKYIGVDHALTVSNGTCAIHLALLALDIKLGDEVIVPDLTFAATINAVLHAGATPVIVDVDRDTWNISSQAIKEAITKKTKAIIPVHLYGNVCKMDEILQISKEFNLYVIEDAAEALGSEYKNKKTGSFGNAGTFSFFGNKTITTGEGGMVVFKDKSHYLRAKKMRDHGMSTEKRYWHEEVGYNYRMTNLQAALGVAQMENITNIIGKKVALGDNYNQLFSSNTKIEIQKVSDNVKSTYWLYSILFLDDKQTRDNIISSFKEHNIECRPVFYPLSAMPLYQKYSLSKCKNAAFISKYGISFPSYLTKQFWVISKNIIE